MKLCPISLKTLMKTVMQLGFQEEPPYDEIIEQMNHEIKSERRFGPDCMPIPHIFEWEQNIVNRAKSMNEIHLRRNSMEPKKKSSIIIQRKGHLRKNDRSYDAHVLARRQVSRNLSRNSSNSPVS